MSARSFAVTIAALAVLGLLAFGLIKKSSGGVEIGEATPVTTLPELNGSGTGSLADYRGEWVLVNVWASWCGPCREESPALERISRRHRSRLTVLGIDTRDLSDDGRDFLAEFGISYPQLRDGDGDYARELGTTGVPESFLVGPDGTLVDHFPGPFADDEAIEGFAAPAIGGAA
jgi:cytochrome c biogenesis protein CcmG/thiol:disulfide interchange protein DsbE